jgi:hypothetical protein
MRRLDRDTDGDACRLSAKSLNRCLRAVLARGQLVLGRSRALTSPVLKPALSTNKPPLHLRDFPDSEPHWTRAEVCGPGGTNTDVTGNAHPTWHHHDLEEHIS